MNVAGEDYDTLRAVAYVFEKKQPDLYLPHVMSSITEFIGIAPEWTLSRACDEDRPRLMRLLLSRPDSIDVDPRVVAQMCNEQLMTAANSGCLRVFKDFVRFFPNLVITSAVVDIAVKKGHAHIVSWLLQQERVVWREEVLTAAATHGSISGVKRLLQGLHWHPTAEMLRIAIAYEHVDLAQWLWLDFCARDDLAVLEEAIALAPLGLARWMVSSAPSSLRVSIDIAAGRGDLPWIKWAHARGAIATVNAMDFAAEGGHHEVLVWLHVHRSEGSSHGVIDQVAKYGRLSVVKWLHFVQARKWTSAALYNAATNGQLDVLQWLLRIRRDLVSPPSTFDDAAANGHLLVVKWMTLANIGHATHRAMDSAATNGHDNVVFFLHVHRAEGCTTAAMDGAAANGHVNVLSFLGRERREGCTTAAFDNAALNNQRGAMGYLHALRSEGFTSAALRNAASSGSLFNVQWLVEAFDMPITSEVVDAAIGSGDTDLVRWLVYEHDQWGTTAGVDAAVGAGHFDVLACMQQLRPIYCSARAVSAAVETRELYLTSWAYNNCHEPVYVDANSAKFWRLGWNQTVVRSAFSKAKSF